MLSRRQSVSKIFLMLLFMLSVSFAVRAQQQVDPQLYGGMKWRLIGPFRGGRAIAVSGVPSQPCTYYLGTVAGGVWKTTYDGVTWNPLFDKQNISSIGAPCKRTIFRLSESPPSNSTGSVGTFTIDLGTR